MKKADKLRMYELKKKSPGAAVGLSLLFTGAGHWYTKEVARGFICLILQVGLWFILMGWIMWILAPIDAYYMTKKHNEKLQLELGLKPEDVE